MAGNPIALEEFARLADKRLDQVLDGELKPYEEKIGELFGSMPLDKRWAEIYGVGGTPDIPVFTGKLDFLSVFPEFYTRCEPKTYAGGLQFEKEFIEDKQYPVLDDRQSRLVAAYGRTKEKAAVRAFGNGFSTGWDYMTNEEGVSLFNSAHTTKSGVSTASGFGNAGTAALNKTNLAATWILTQMFRDDIGELFQANYDTVLVPMALADTAYEVTGYDPRGGARSQLDPDTARHKINVDYGRFKVIVWKRLDLYSTKSWYLIDSTLAKKLLKWIDRVNPETATEADFHTFAILQSIRGRFGWYWSNWRWMYGQNVS